MSKAYYVKEKELIRLTDLDKNQYNSLQDKVIYNDNLSCYELPIKYYDLLDQQTTISKSLQDYIDIANLDIPDADYWNSLIKDITLRPFQVEFLQWLEARRQLSYPPKSTQRGVLCSLSQGLGKSVTALVVDSHFRTINFTHKTLLVCRSNNKRSTWQYHLDKYTKLNYIIIEGTKAQRLGAIEEFKKHKDLAIIHYEGMRLHKEELVGIPDLVIIDEAQAISNFESQQSQVADKISEKAKYTLLLSGGVAQNRVAKQLWLPLKLLDRKVWSSYQLWVRDWCLTEEIYVPLFVKGKKVINWQTKKIVTRKINQVTGIKDPEALAIAVTPYIYQKRKEDVGEQLPEKIYQIIETGLYTKQRELYRKIRDEVATQIKGMTISNSLVKLLRLYQTCATLAYFDMDDISSKADEAVEEILNIPPDTKALVFSQFVQLCNGVYKRLKKEGINVAIITGESSTTKGDTRDNIRKEFKEGDTTVLIATTMIEGTGSSYKEASYLFRLDRMAAVLLNDQADDRIVRLDSAHKTVNIIDFVSRNTIEEIQLEILKEKMTDIKNIFDLAYEYNMGDIHRMLEILPKGD